MVTSAEVVVVGAGLAGLTTAHLLRRQGVDVLVLEAKGRVGGRLKNQTVDGAVVDAGGSWIGPPQRNVSALVEELGLSTFPQHDDGEHLLLFGGRTDRYSGDAPPLGWPALVDYAQAAWRLDRDARRVGSTAPWSHADADRFDRQTLGAWLRTNTRTAGATFLFDNIAATVFGCRADELSVLAFLIHVASAGGLAPLVNVRGAAQDRHIVGGAAGMCDELARRLSPRVRRNTPVRRVDQSGARVRIITSDDEFEARRVVLAVDPATAAGIEHQPPLPARRHTFERTYAMGTGVKVHVSYAEPFWRHDGLSGQSFADRGCVRVTFDVTPPGGPGVLMAFTDLDATPEARRDTVVSELVARFGEPARHPTGYVEQNWAHEPYQRGCVPRLSPGVITSGQDAATRPIGAVHFAGAETSEVWEAYMDGAVGSAHRVVAEVMSVIGAAAGTPS